MSKRTRGARRAPHVRPGGRPPQARPARPAPSRLEAAERAAADLASGDLASAAHELEEVPAPPILTPRGATATARPAPRPGGTLAIKAATEYLYVAEDVRRIGSVAVVLFGIMLVLWVLIELLHIIRI